MKKQVKIEINITNKAFYTIVTLGILLLIGGIVFAYHSRASPSIMGHSAEEIEVNVGGQLMSLQEAIDDGVIGGAKKVYDTGWIDISEIEFNGRYYDINHNLGTQDFSSILIEFKTDDGEILYFDGSRVDYDRAPTEYNKNFGWVFVIKNNNSIRFELSNKGLIPGIDNKRVASFGGNNYVLKKVRIILFK